MKKAVILRCERQRASKDGETNSGRRPSRRGVKNAVHLRVTDRGTRLEESESHVPGALRHEVTRCRTGIVAKAAVDMVPASAMHRSALHRVRDTRLNRECAMNIMKQGFET